MERTGVSLYGDVKIVAVKCDCGTEFEFKGELAVCPECFESEYSADIPRAEGFWVADQSGLLPTIQKRVHYLDYNGTPGVVYIVSCRCHTIMRVSPIETIECPVCNYRGNLSDAHGFVAACLGEGR